MWKTDKVLIVFLLIMSVFIALVIRSEYKYKVKCEALGGIVVTPSYRSKQICVKTSDRIQVK